MSTHYHSEDIEEYGLQDGCERCDEHAAHPLDTLDDSNVWILLERIRHNVPARSDNEAEAMRNIKTAQRHADRLKLFNVRSMLMPANELGLTP